MGKLRKRNERPTTLCSNFDVHDIEFVRQKKEQHLQGLLRLNQMSEASTSELVRFAMQEGIRLTHSRIGFIQFLGAEDIFSLFSAGPSGKAEAMDPTTTRAFRTAIEGILCQASDRKSRFLLKKLRFIHPPEPISLGGETQLISGFCVPIYYRGKLFSLAGVANREGAYEKFEIQSFALLLENMCRMVFLRDAESERERMRQALAQLREQEIAIGSQIQQLLLMGRLPRGIKGARIAATTIPSLGVDGDFFDFFKMSQSIFNLLVGDVMGKGVPAALMGAATKSQFQKALSHLLVVLPRNRFPTPEEVVAEAHAKITPQLSLLESFVSVHFGQFDFISQTLTLVNCGHTGVIHFRRRTKKVTLSPGGFPPLGIDLSTVYKQTIQPFEPGDVFLFYSDGVTEARNSIGGFFGTDSLIRLVEEHQTSRPADLIGKIKAAVVAFSGSTSFHDDLTLVVVAVKG